MNDSAKVAGHAFISYARDDAQQAERLQRTLEAAGIPVWRDTQDIWPGEDWRFRIRQAIASDSVVFIACFSSASIAGISSRQNEELVLATDQLRLRRPGGAWLLPVRFDDCVIPDWDLGGGRTLASLMAADLFGDYFDSGAGRLIEAIKRLLGARNSPASRNRGSDRGNNNAGIVTRSPEGVSVQAGWLPGPRDDYSPEFAGQTRIRSAPGAEKAMIIEVAIEPAGSADHFRSAILRSPAGEASAYVNMDLAAVSALGEELQLTLPMSAKSSRYAAAEASRQIRDVGERLFAALLGAEPVAGLYRANQERASERSQDLQIRLRIEDPRLAALPWELMHDPVKGTYAGRKDQLIRNVPAASAREPLRIRPPLRILGITSSPTELRPVIVDRERHLLDSALNQLLDDGLAEITWAPAATWNAVHDLLLDGGSHVVHFTGHGGYSPAYEESVLVLTREDGRADPVSASRFADLLRQSRPMPRLVVLSSGHGTGTGFTGRGTQFSGIAQALIRGGVSAVVAMQYELSQQAALAFARGFYTAIARGRGPDEAMASGRIAILGTGSDAIDWAIPVLSLQG